MLSCGRGRVQYSSLTGRPSGILRQLIGERRRNRIHRVPQSFPFVISAAQRTHALDSHAVQGHRHLGGSGFARAGAIKYDVAVARNLVAARSQRLRRDVQRPGQQKRIRQKLKGMAQIHDEDRLSSVELALQLERFQARFGRVSRNVVVALSYDSARAALSGIANALIAIPDEVRAGLEKIKWMPCTNGGPATYLTFAPHDHRGYKGDFLTIRELRGGELHFRGYYRPQWPSNKQVVG